MNGPGAYLHRLERELSAAGLPARRRARIISEFADHLASDPSLDLARDPDTILGAPNDLARQFADELGTSLARAAAIKTFVALAVCGGLVTIRVATLGRFNQVGGPSFDSLGLLACVFAAQIAFVAGTLGLARALRLRRRTTISRAEAVVLSRRAGVGIAAAAVSVLAVPLRVGAARGVGSSVPWLSMVAIAVGLIALAMAARFVRQAVQLRPLAGGPAGDVFGDLGLAAPLARRLAGGSATRFALVTAFILSLVIALAGVATDDPFDGLARGLLEGIAFLAAYAALGGYLGLRRSATGT